MTVEIQPVSFDAIRGSVTGHWSQCSSGLDGFLEAHILGSRHYAISMRGNAIGFASVHEGKLLTQLALRNEFKHLGHNVLARVRQLEEVQSAFVSTSDEFLLSLMLDTQRRTTLQAYLFATESAAQRDAAPSPYTLRLATISDQPLIQRESGDFFYPLDSKLQQREIYLTSIGEECVGFGILERSRLVASLASVGMFSIERFRGRGVGAATISLLLRECQRQEIRPIAGCWYYNQ